MAYGLENRDAFIELPDNIYVLLAPIVETTGAKEFLSNLPAAAAKIMNVR